MEEVWKDIPNYEGHYQASNLGRIKSLKRKGRILKQGISHNGYLSVVLSKNGKVKTYRVHRLICNTFIDNHFNKPEINHIDGNKKNNKISNLEWCTCSENMIHAYSTGIFKASGPKKNINQFNINGTFIRKWNSQSEAAKQLNIHQSAISNCCNQKVKTVGGYVWKFAQEK